MSMMRCILIDDDVDEHLIFSMALEETGKNIECIYFTDCQQAASFLATTGINSPGYIFFGYAYRPDYCGGMSSTVVRVVDLHVHKNYSLYQPRVGNGLSATVSSGCLWRIA